MDNKNLFWYGFFANTKKFFGKLFIVAGITTALFFKDYFWFISLPCIIIGIVLIAKGSSQRFDYKRQSGYMVHGGDR